MEDQTAQQTKSTVVVVGDDILVRMTIAEYLRDLRFPRHRGGHRRRSGYTSATSQLGNRHGVERRPPWRWYGRLCRSAVDANAPPKRAGRIGWNSGSGGERGGVIVRRGSPSLKAVRSADRAGSDQTSPRRAQMMLTLNGQAAASQARTELLPSAEPRQSCLSVKPSRHFPGVRGREHTIWQIRKRAVPDRMRDFGLDAIAPAI
jgi:hypothetical protein